MGWILPDNSRPKHHDFNQKRKEVLAYKLPSKNDLFTYLGIHTDDLLMALREHIYINISILTLLIRNQGSLKRKTRSLHLPHSTSFEVEDVRIVVISFRNIAKKFCRKMLRNYEKAEILPNGNFRE